MFIKLIQLFACVIACCVQENVAKTIGERSATDTPKTDILTHASTSKDQKKEFWRVAVHSMECTKRKQGKLHYDVEKGRLLLCYHSEWRELGWKTNSPQKGKLPTSCLDAKFKGLDKGKGDGLYWINPEGEDDLRNSFLAYCDMSSGGGGWTLVAKITNNYAWICPERKGANCLGSTVDPLTANLFHLVHTRDFVDLSITSDENSGIHLANPIIRKLFTSGRQSVRFSFVTSSKGWTPSEDAYAAFSSEKPNQMFLGKAQADYSSDKGDYTWNVLRHERKHLTFPGPMICWGMEVTDYRYYDQGLHVGTPSKGDKKCHLSFDEHQVMLQSHYARVDPTGREAKWDPAQFGFLGSKRIVQAPCKRIALWVR